MKEKTATVFIRCVFFVFALFFINSNAFSDSLYVFYPIAERPNVIQTKLSEVFPGTDITVFGRVNDFATKIQESPPDAILSKPATIQMFGNYAIQLQGHRKGSTEEKFILLSVDKSIDTGNLSASTVGMIDILGRKEMIDFLNSFFSSPPKLKRVTKMEDLLPLLTFNMCSAILIAEHSVDYFKSISKLNFVVTPTPDMKTGIIALAIKNGRNGDAIVKSAKEMKTDVNTLLEVDSWK